MGFGRLGFRDFACFLGSGFGRGGFRPFLREGLRVQDSGFRHQYVEFGVQRLRLSGARAFSWILYEWPDLIGCLLMDLHPGLLPEHR